MKYLKQKPPEFVSAHQCYITVETELAVLGFFPTPIWKSLKLTSSKDSAGSWQTSGERSGVAYGTGMGRMWVIVQRHASAEVPYRIYVQLPRIAVDKINRPPNSPRDYIAYEQNSFKSWRNAKRYIIRMVDAIENL